MRKSTLRMLSYGIYGYFMLIIIVVSVLAYAITHAEQKNHLQTRVLTITVIPTPTLIKRTLYEEEKAKILKILSEQDPETALNTLAKDADNNPHILKLCHGIAHIIGHKAYEQYNHNFHQAMEFQSDICGSGYIHGVIEEHFAHVKDVNTEMFKVCATQEGKCFHGVGHGFMYYTYNDLPQSLQLCDKYTDSFARSNCYDGVFMENFATSDEDHPTIYLKADEPLYPCPTLSTKYKDNCYFYAPRYYLTMHEDDYKATFQLCLTAEKGYIASCLRGVGSISMKENLDNIFLVEDVCSTGTPDQNAECITGMKSYYSVHFASYQKGQDLCNSLSPEHKRTCLSSTPYQRSVLGIFTTRFSF